MFESQGWISRWQRRWLATGSSVAWAFLLVLQKSEREKINTAFLLSPAMYFFNVRCMWTSMHRSVAVNVITQLAFFSVN